MLRIILSSVVILFSSLSALVLSRLLSIKKVVIDQTLNDLHSVLDILNDQSQSLCLHHPSFRDYLLNNTRYRN